MIILFIAGPTLSNARSGGGYSGGGHSGGFSTGGGGGFSSAGHAGGGGYTQKAIYSEDRFCPDALEMKFQKNGRVVLKEAACAEF